MQKSSVKLFVNLKKSAKLPLIIQRQRIRRNTLNALQDGISRQRQNLATTLCDNCRVLRLAGTPKCLSKVALECVCHGVVWSG